jgi:integration host factor subunit alpha
LRIGFSKQEAARTTELFFDIIKETLERGEKIKNSGFGNFVVRAKRSRRGRNPQTGDDITITPRKALTFKSSPLLKQALNNK